MQVSLFVTCMVDMFYPQVGVSTVRLLRKLGCEVDFPPGQTCCGQPAFNSGYAEATRESATTLVTSFRHSEVVVTPSGSCAAMVRKYYPQLFAGTEWEEDAIALAAKTMELSEFITEKLGVTDLGGAFAGKATYHRSCHMSRGLGVREAPMALLSHVDQLEMVDLPFADECCGFGGTFAVKMAGLSTAMVDDKAKHVVETGANILVGSDMACLMNIGGRLEKEGHTHLRVMHLAELLDAATEREPSMPVVEEPETEEANVNETEKTGA